jgi:iron(III) transport system permease protein
MLFMALLMLFVVYPIISVLGKSLDSPDGSPLTNYRALFTKPHLARTIWSSLLMGLAAAILSTLLGLAISLAVLKTDLPLRRLFAVAAVLPMIMPGFVNSLAYIFLFGRNGLITYRLLGLTWEIYSWRSVLILQTLGFTTTAFLLISSVLIGVGSQAEDAARNLGASEWEVLVTVTLPLIRPGLVSTLLLIFLRSMADFGTPFIVGGRFNTLATASYTQLIGTYNMEMAATLNVVLLVLCLAVFWLYTRAQMAGQEVRLLAADAAQSPGHRAGGGRRTLALSRPVKAVIWTLSMAFAVVTLMLLISIGLAAFTKHLGGNSTLTLEHLSILPQRGWNSLRNTLVFSAITSVAVGFSGILLAYLLTRFAFVGNRALDLLATLPFAIPGTFMGVGYALAFSRPPLVLVGTYAIVVACTVVRELPLGLRAASSVLSQQDRSIEDASANLGASRLTTFSRIVVPLARPAVLVTALYAFVFTVKTLGAIIFIITPSNKMLSVDVFEATVRGDMGDAAAFSLVIIVVAALGVAAIYLLGREGAAQAWLRRILGIGSVT